jgi:molybdenum cofactor cytidylyltransferase
MRMSVAAIIVAAGSSSRLGRPKQLVMIDGEPLLQRAIRIAHEAGAAPVVVVLGAYRKAIEEAVDFGAALIAVNGEWEEGIASSIREGIRAVEMNAADAAGALLMSCDQPRVTSDHLRGMITRFVLQSEPTVVASAYAGIRGIPAIFPRQAYPDLMALRGDQGARQLFDERAWRLVSMPLAGGEVDIDEPEDLGKLS